MGQREATPTVWEGHVRTLREAMMRQREVRYTGPNQGCKDGPEEPAGVFACGGICPSRAYLLKFHLLETVATMSNFRCFILFYFILFFW